MSPGQKVPEHSVVPRRELLWHPRALLWHSHQEPPQGEASWSPGHCLVKKPLCANPGPTSLTISKLLFPRLCNHDNASIYLRLRGGINEKYLHMLSQ